MRMLILAVLLVGSVSAHGAEEPQQPPFGVWGHGANTSCGEWLQARKREIPEWNSEGQYVLGYISAASFFSVAKHVGWNSSGYLAETDALAIFAWVDNYCTENPLDELWAASVRLVQELAKRAG